MGVGAAGYNDVVVTIPWTVDKCVVANNIKVSINVSVEGTGGIGGAGDHVPGIVTLLLTTAIFWIEPAAGITGIGNGCNTAPVQ